MLAPCRINPRPEGLALPSRPRPGRHAPSRQLAVARHLPNSEPSTSGRPSSPDWKGALRGGALGLLAAAAVATATAGPAAPPAFAADAAKVGTCLLRSCQAALATCLTDVQCVENLVCLQACNTSPDEVGCQIKCGDQYADKAIEAFNACAVSEKKCVPQRVDEGLYPEPPPAALADSFDLSGFQGRWYITAGLNPLFDTFDCQEHYFASPEPGKLYAKIQWRIPRGNEDFIERNTMQSFVQVDPARPAVLYNGGNEYLHYEDTWYILAYKPEQYVFIYYVGQNDAWKGYGGATVYTRVSSLPAEYVPELREAAARAGLDWDAFALTDNTCAPHPKRPSIVREVEQDLGKMEYELENDLKSFGKGFTVLEKDLEEEVQLVERAIEAEVKEVEQEVEQEVLLVEQKAERLIKRFEMEASMGPFGQLFKWIPMGVKDIIMPIR